MSKTIPMSIFMYGMRKCNMNCGYCNGGAVRDGDTKEKFVFDKDRVYSTIMNYPPYVKALKQDKNTVHSFEIWGGNPLFHFEEFKQVVEFLQEKFPKSIIATTDNCLSFKKDEIVDYLILHNISVQISHDGLGQFVRSGELDPLYDKKISSNIVKMMKLGLVTQINCMHSAASPSLFKNIEYFNKWRWDNGVEGLNIPIKLNKLLDSDYDIKRINTTGMWAGEIREDKKGKPIGNIAFNCDSDEFKTYIHELRILGIYYRQLRDRHEEPNRYFAPYKNFILSDTSNYRKRTPYFLDENNCISFQRGYTNYNFCIDTLGKYCECDLIDSGEHTIGNKGYLPDYCKDCKYNEMNWCHSCGSIPYPKKCFFRYQLAQLQEEFYLLDNKRFLYESDFNLKVVK